MSTCEKCGERWDRHRVRESEGDSLEVVCPKSAEEEEPLVGPNCSCGWPLPGKTFALHAVTKEQMAEAVIVIVCPTCERPHGFAVAELAAAIGGLAAGVNSSGGLG